MEKNSNKKDKKQLRKILATLKKSKVRSFSEYQTKNRLEDEEEGERSARQRDPDKKKQTDQYKLDTNKVTSDAKNIIKRNKDLGVRNISDVNLTSLDIQKQNKKKWTDVIQSKKSGIGKSSLDNVHNKK